MTALDCNRRAHHAESRQRFRCVDVSLLQVRQLVSGLSFEVGSGSGSGSERRPQLASTCDFRGWATRQHAHVFPLRQPGPRAPSELQWTAVPSQAQAQAQS